MKKVIATLIAVMVLVASFATVTAFAAPSPSAKPEYKIEITTYSTGEATEGTYTTLEDGSIQLDKAEDAEGTFKGWVINVIDDQGNAVAAVEGVDYVVISGSLEDGTLVIKPLTDLVIKETYDVADAEDEKPAGDENDSEESPETGSKALASVAVLTMLSLAGAVAVKKVRA